MELKLSKPAHATGYGMALSELPTFTLQARGARGNVIPMKNLLLNTEMERERQELQVLTCSKQADNKQASAEDL